jgi:osmotically-inducible protein OsmY
MVIREFVRNVGEKVLPDKGNKSSSGSTSGNKQQQQYSGTRPAQQGSSTTQSSGKPAQAGRSAQSASDERARDAILQHIKDNVAEAPEDLVVAFDADDGVVILTGTTRSDEVAELIIITAGNIEGVGQVDDRMTRAEGGSRSSGGAARGSTTRSR